MEGLIALVILVVVALPLVGFFMGLGTRSRLEEAEKRLLKLEHELNSLRERASSTPQAQQPGTESSTPTSDPSTSSAAELLPPPESAPEPKHGPKPSHVSPPLLPDLATALQQAPTPEAAQPVPASPPPSRPVPERRKEPINWEQFMGVRLFAWLGGLALFLAAAFFVKYSFDHDLVPPWIRVTIGFLAGMGLMAGGLVLTRRNYPVTAHTLCATGVVILYAVTFACRAIYHFPLFGAVPTFCLMTLITAAAFFLAVRLNAMVVAVLGMLGGFLTPVLLSTGQDHPFGLFSYIALLDLGLLAVASVRRWDWLNLAAAAGTLLLQAGWTLSFFEVSKVWIALVILLGFDGLYLGGCYWARRRGQLTLWLEGAAAGLAIFTLVYVSFLLLHAELGARPVVLALFLFGADACLVALSVLSERLRRIHLLGGGMIFVLLGAWTAWYLTEPLLLWGLGMYLVFAVVHTMVPVLLQLHHKGKVSELDRVLCAHLPDGWTPERVQAQIPALSAALPFILLIMVVGRLPLFNPTPVFALALGLLVFLLEVSRRWRWDWLPLIGLGCVFLLECAWHVRLFREANALLPLFWYTAFYVATAGYPFVCLRGQADRMPFWMASALSGPLHFILHYNVVLRAWPNEFMGLVPALFVVPSLAALAGCWKHVPLGHPGRNAVLACFGGATLWFISLIFPIQFERQWLTLAWALEGVALLWLYFRVPHPGLRGVGVALLVVAFVRLALNPAVLSYHPRAAVPLFNWYLWTYGLVAGCLFMSARLARPPGHLILGRDPRRLFYTLGTVLCFLLMNIEIADYFTAPGTRVLTFQFGGHFGRDMTYSIAWALFALMLVTIGIFRNLRAARYAGLCLLGITLLKLFLHDLASLNQLYRVGALVGVAVVAMVASFLYQKYLRPSAAAPKDARVPPESSGS